MIKTLIFDFDGLILDTETNCFQVWQEAYREHKCELALEEWAACVGGTEDHFDPYVHLESLLGRPLERETFNARLSNYELERANRLTPFPGVEAYLEEARRLRLKLGLASNSSRKWVMGHLERLGLTGYFDVFRFREDVTQRKPHPEIYQSVLQNLETSASEALAFEDSPHGVRAAQAAGIFCVAVPNSITTLLGLDHADLLLTSMADLPLADLLARVESYQKTLPA